MRQRTRLALAIWLAAWATGCATSPRSAPTRTAERLNESARAAPSVLPLSPQCASFCARIRSSSEEIDHPELSELLCSIARCETGDRCMSRIDSPGRRYRGAFQFSSRTWRGVCYPIFSRLGMAACRKGAAIHDLSCSTACSAEIIAQDKQGGIGNWPVCGKRAATRFRHSS